MIDPIKDALTSGVPGWREFNLDTEPSDGVYLPSSLRIESRRPHGSDES